MMARLPDNAPPTEPTQPWLYRTEGTFERPFLSRLLMILIVIVGVSGGGFLQFAANLERLPLPADVPADGIVVLTGGAARLDKGLDLLVRDKGKKLLISGVDRKTTAAALQARSARAPEKFACCVELGHEAADTIGNAREAAFWAANNSYTSLYLVTASYHMPRAMLLFRRAMPDTVLNPVPVFPRRVHLDDWWLWPGTARLLIVEYAKYVVSLLRARLGLLPVLSAAPPQ